MCKWEWPREIEGLTKIAKVIPLNTIFNKDKRRCWGWRESVLSSDQEKHNKQGWSCYTDSSLLFPLITGIFVFFHPSFSGMGFLDSSIGKESACNEGYSGSIPVLGRSSGEGIGYPLQYSWSSFVAQLVKNQPAMWETWDQFLGWEDHM